MRSRPGTWSGGAPTRATGAILAEVTERGAGVLAEIRATGGAEAGRIFGRLSPAERAELARILSELREPSDQGAGSG